MSNQRREDNKRVPKFVIESPTVIIEEGEKMTNKFDNVAVFNDSVSLNTTEYNLLFASEMNKDFDNKTVANLVNQDAYIMQEGVKNIIIENIDEEEDKKSLEDPTLEINRFRKYKLIGLFNDPLEEKKQYEGYIPVCNVNIRDVNGNPDVPYFITVHTIIAILNEKFDHVDMDLVDRIAYAVRAYIARKWGKILDKMDGNVSHWIRQYKTFLFGLQRRTAKQPVLRQEDIWANDNYSIPLYSLEGIIDTLSIVRAEGEAQGQIPVSMQDYRRIYSDLKRQDENRDIVQAPIRGSKSVRSVNDKVLKKLLKKIDAKKKHSIIEHNELNSRILEEPNQIINDEKKQLALEKISTIIEIVESAVVNEGLIREEEAKSEAVDSDVVSSDYDAYSDDKGEDEGEESEHEDSSHITQERPLDKKKAAVVNRDTERQLGIENKQIESLEDKVLKDKNLLKKTIENPLFSKMKYSNAEKDLIEKMNIQEQFDFLISSPRLPVPYTRAFADELKKKRNGV